MKYGKVNNNPNLVSESIQPSEAELNILGISEKKFNNKVKMASGIDIKHPNLRIIERNVIYLIGIKPEIAENDILTSNRFFGQYGRISKIHISKKPFYLKHTQDYCYSAYVTFQDRLSASLAVAGLDNFVFEGKKMEASYATNRYCQSFLYGQPCIKNNCNYIHHKVDDNDCFIKEDGLDNRDIFQSQKVYAYRHIFQTAKEVLREMEVEVTNPELPNISFAVQKAEEFFKKGGTNQPQLFEERDEKYSAYQKIQRLSDSRVILKNLDINFMNFDGVWRKTGYFYILNKRNYSFY